MSNIKINYTNIDGKRTSTTINRAIAKHFYYTTDDYETNRGKGIPSDYNERIKKEVQEFVNEMNLHIDKDYIENSLLFEIADRKRAKMIEHIYKRD